MNTAVALMQLNLSEAPCKIKLAMKRRERDVLSDDVPISANFLFFLKMGEEASHFWSTAVWKIKAHLKYDLFKAVAIKMVTVFVSCFVN